MLTHSDYLFCIVPQQVFAAASKVISFAMAALQKREKVVRNAQAPDDRLQIEPKAHTLSEMKQRIRELLRATPFKPFVIQTADGREYKVEHPDFVLAAGTDSPNVLLEDATGEVHFLSALLITGVSVLVAA